MIARRLKISSLHRITSCGPGKLKYFHAVNVQTAHQPFDEILHRNELLSVNRSMVDSIHGRDAIQGLQLFRNQLRLGLPLNVDEVTVALAFKSCGGDVAMVGHVHRFAVASGFSCYTSVSNSLMSAYFKGGEFVHGMRVFESMGDPDVVSWNAVISGCKTSEDALSFGIRMNSSGVTFDAVSCTTLLAFCAGYEGLLFGSQLHCWYHSSWWPRGVCFI